MELLTEYTSNIIMRDLTDNRITVCNFDPKFTGVKGYELPTTKYQFSRVHTQQDLNIVEGKTKKATRF